MNLYLIRHADALDAADDAARELSKRGREQVQTLGEFLRGNEAFAPHEFWHSPLVRARQTAELLAETMKLRLPLVETRGLRPEDDPAQIVQRIARSQLEAVALVGHEPHLSALASLLVAGAAEPVRFVFKKGTILALEGAPDYWVARWQVSPELLK